MMKKVCILLLMSMLIAGTVSANIIDGLIGYWKLDETSGTTIYDETSNDNDGTINGTLDRRTGKVGNSLYFTAVGDFAEIPHASSLDMPTSEMTVSCWIKIPTVVGIYCQWVGKHDQDAGSYIGWWLTSFTGSHPSWQVKGDLNATGPTAPTAVNDGSWHHIVAVSSETTQYIYVDGVEDHTWDVDPCDLPFPINSDDSLLIGGALTGWGLTNPLNAEIDEIAIWDRPLSADDVLTLFTLVEIEDWRANRPDPNDFEENVKLDKALSWTAGDDAKTPGAVGVAEHHVYFGTDPNQMKFADKDSPSAYFQAPYQTTLAVGTTTWDPPGDLDFGSTYLWRIDEDTVTGAGGLVLKSPVWSFSTIYPGTISPDYSRIDEGGSETLSIVMDAIFTPTGYQWYKNGVAVSNDAGHIAGATTDTLSITNAVGTDTGDYTCEVTTVSFGTVGSNIAVVWVNHLVGRWELDGDLTDSSSLYSNTGVIVGDDPNYVADVPSYLSTTQSIKFFGDMVIEIPSPDQFDGYEQVTVRAWVKPGVENSFYEGIVGKEGVLNGGWYMGMWGASDNPQFRVQADGSTLEVGGATILPETVWHQVTAVYEQGVAQSVYVDGAVSGTASSPDFPIEDTAREVSIGGVWNSDISDYGFHFYGYIADVEIFNYAKDVEDVATDWEALTGLSTCVYPLGYDTDGDCDVDLTDFVPFILEWLDCGLIPISYCP